MPKIIKRAENVAKQLNNTFFAGYFSKALNYKVR